jgi:hypothetical protein
MSLLNKLKVGDELPESVIKDILITSTVVKTLNRWIYVNYSASYISTDYILFPYVDSRYHWILLNYNCKDPLPW